MTDIELANGYESSFLRAYTSLPVKKQGRVPIPRPIVDLFGVVVGLVKLIALSSGDGLTNAQMEEYFSRFDERTLDDAAEALRDMAKDEAPLKVLKRFSSRKAGLTYLQRVLGPDGAELVMALNEDLVFLTVFADQMLRGIMPVIKAWEDTLYVLNDQSRRELSEAIPLPIGLLQLLIDFENEFGRKVLAKLPDDMVDAAVSQVAIFDTSRFMPDRESVDKYLNSDAENRIRLIDESLVKKLRGAVTALQVSEDGVSQAANSLTELIDRLLRDFANDDETMTWLETNCLADDTTIYRKDGVIRPTKLGQCLCFLYGGGTVPERIEGNEQGSEMLATLYYYLAKSMTCARNRLQKIKHSDVGGDEEKREIEEARLAILGVVEIAHRFCWVYKGELPHCFKPANRIDSGRSQSPALPDGSISPS